MFCGTPVSTNAESARTRIMKPIKSTLAILAMLSVAGPLSADETLQVRNCTWCHGSSAQGFMRAPRLAGQRDQYIENQLLSFQQHTRDNPRSQQYMWAASANLSPETAHDLAAYFSTVPPKAANDGDANYRSRRDAPNLRREKSPNPMSSPASSVMARMRKGCGKSPAWAASSCISYLKEKLEQWGAGVSMRPRGRCPDREHIVARPN